MKYKVWVHIEEIDEENDHYEDVGMPISVGEYDLLSEAAEQVATLAGVSINDITKDLIVDERTWR